MKAIKKKKFRKAHPYGKATAPVQATTPITITHQVTMVMRGSDLVGALDLGSFGRIPPE